MLGLTMRRLHLPALLTGCLLLAAGCAPEKDRDFTTARQRMLHDQLTGPGRGIKDARVLAAMRTVPRHEFVPEDVRFSAYDDRPLPIGHGQTISQPFIVAFMTEQLKPQPTDKVLEVGTGSGYQAAVLSGLVKAVFTIEIVEPLAKRAAAGLHRLGYTNVLVRAGDGYQGWPEHAPFDAIIVTCAPDRIPQPLVEQLKEGGRMIIPVGPEGGLQELYLLEKRGGELKQQAVLPVRFVPMTRGPGAQR
ncbi:MAG: protein-L-isoaspartate(D-aspartate) O-methyltransferase [Limisphaerales bacterium]|nr:MAG: protein-L-isoaspartate(D-aspartate) O-methyltransferase [Limisphaerales bacterium]KAG0510745.1 MAG: protein-L-isoaspartate(D-aspartate) O-methyltransferase [Limisphaerales bacterium]TXT52641.1 MAG: protein-L-isoaspartate(D-aspartate) O-methyltransferase [Limisphaerales bacterium]